MDGRTDLGPLPGASQALLIALSAVWVLLGANVLIGAVKKSKKRKS